MSRIVVLIKLDDGIEREAYEAWASETDLPAIRALDAVERFDIVRFRRDGGDPAYDYAEIAEVTDMAAFAKQLSSEDVQRDVADLAKYCSSPVLLVGDEL
jgi:hypothetical protein